MLNDIGKWSWNNVKWKSSWDFAGGPVVKTLHS